MMMETATNVAIISDKYNNTNSIKQQQKKLHEDLQIKLLLKRITEGYVTMNKEFCKSSESFVTQNGRSTGQLDEHASLCHCKGPRLLQWFN